MPAIPSSSEIAGRALQRGDQRSPSEQRTGGSRFEALARGTEGLLDQLSDLGTVLGDHAQGVSRQSGVLQRLDTFLSPGHILKHTDREPPRLDVEHGRNLARDAEEQVQSAGCTTSRSSAPDRAARGPRICWRGAGPACFCSIPSHPREKPCGGGITGRALALVADALPRPVPAVTIRSARFIDGSANDSAAVDLSGHAGMAALMVSDRTAFDGLLLDAACRAGAKLVAARAADVRRVARGFEIDTSDGQTLARADDRRRRRREQPGAAQADAPVCAPRVIDRNRLLRSRRHQRRDPSGVRGRSAWLHLVVPAAQSSGGRRLRTGGCRCLVGRVA